MVVLQYLLVHLPPCRSEVKDGVKVRRTAWTDGLMERMMQSVMVMMVVMVMVLVLAGAPHMLTHRSHDVFT